MPRIRLRTLVALALLTLVPLACGGGGGGSTPIDVVDVSAPDTAADVPLDVPAPPPDVPADVPPDPRASILAIDETGTFVLPALEGEVHVVRTEADIPHIYATNQHDLRVAQGFVVARDRYFELELARRLALGEMSGLLGDIGLAIDQQTRGRGMRHIAERILAGLTPDQAAELDAFAAGVNAYVDAVKAGTLEAPSELAKVAPLLGAARPTDLMPVASRRDAAGFAAFVVFELGYEATDVRRQEIADQIPGLFDNVPFGGERRAGVLEDLWNPVRPVREVASAGGFGLETGASVPSSGEAKVRRRATPSRPGPGLSAEMNARTAAAEARLAGLFGRGEERDYGSNAWAVGGSGTPDGGAVLAGDGHLSLGIPSVFYQMGLDTQLFGDGDVTLLGLFFPGFPYMAVGTNGRVAWSQTYLYGDVTDWYREELRLGADGFPTDSRFAEEWRPLVRAEETYEIAGVLGGAARSETWARWTTFDGRWIVDIEGRVLAEGEEPPAGKAVVQVQGVRVIPGDRNADGLVTALSFDFTGFDLGDLPGAIEDFSTADDVEDVRQVTRGLVAYAQNIVAADGEGGILYTSFNGMPCRGYLERTPEGEFATGADPRLLLDGTRYGGFTVPVGADGTVDEGPGASDPYRCVVPFDEWPQARDPQRGYVLTANNDPAPISFDDSLADDAHYIGGPWDPGYRAETIRDGLAAIVTARTADLDTMAALQADVRSPVARELVPFLRDVIADARALTDGDTAATDEEEWLVRTYELDRAAFDEADERLAEWLDHGAPAASGVATFYETPASGDARDAVATMVFNQWFRDFMNGVFKDEDIEFVWAPDERRMRMASLTALLAGRGPDNPGGLASYLPQTGESVFFDNINTPGFETSRVVALQSLSQALQELRADPSAPGIGGFGTTDMSAWLWGLRHLVRFESILASYASGNPLVDVLAADFAISPKRLPLADALADDDPRGPLPWFPRHGDFFAVDAGNPSFSRRDFFYGTGPVMRMVIALEDGRVRGQNVLPGGQSGLTSSPHFDDQAALWLGNHTIPMRFHVEDVVAGAVGREALRPE